MRWLPGVCDSRSVARTIPSPAIPALAEAAWLFGHMPSRVRAAGAGDPIVIDGQVLDPEIQSSLPLIDRVGRSGADGAPVPEARESLEKTCRLVRGRRIRIGHVEDLRIGGAGGEIPARLYVPQARPGRGLLVYFHGGGWVLGSLESHDQTCRFLCEHSGQRVLSVDYRLAPEHPFPAAAEDAIAAFRWAHEHAGDLGADPGAIGVGGDSAGGNLSAVVALDAATKGGPAPALQVLIYPVTDLSRRAESYRLFGEGFQLTAAEMEWFSDQYLADPADAADVRVSPLLAPSLAGVSPAFVTIAGFDPLRDEGLAYAQRLGAEGVPTELVVHRGLIHGFANAVGISSTSVVAMTATAGAVRAGLA